MYVLRRMHELHFINDDQFREAQNAPIVVRQAVREVLPVHAESVAEMARQVVFDAYGDEAYTRGLTVWTTVRRIDQDAAYAAVRKGVFDYDRRHGYRGPEAVVNLGDDPADQEQALDKAFGEYPDGDAIYTAVVLSAAPAEVKAVMANGDQIAVSGDGLKFAARALAEKTPANQKLRRGAVVRVTRDDKGRYAIGQMPQAEAAFISVDPEDGAILSLVGGFDFDRNKYNHVTQAFRQPGSSFKPFIYSAALEKGFTPATVINDAPFFVPAAQAGGQDWEPHNYDGKFEGPMRLRVALAKSKNLVTIRVLQAIGPQYAQDYITRFGFDPKLHPAYLTMGLGAGAATPLQMAVGYSVFANGGYRIAPYLIEKITDSKGSTLSQAKPVIAGANAERAIDPRNAFIMNTLLHDVTVYGTAARVRVEFGTQGPRGQDRHHQRHGRRLVLRLQPRARGRRLDRLRPAAHARQQRDGRPGGAAHLDRLHVQGAEDRAGKAARPARRRRAGAHQPGYGPARRVEQHVGLVPQRVHTST